jgi:hypothetical protein
MNDLMIYSSSDDEEIQPMSTGDIPVEMAPNLSTSIASEKDVHDEKEDAYDDDGVNVGVPSIHRTTNKRKVNLPYKIRENLQTESSSKVKTAVVGEKVVKKTKTNVGKAVSSVATVDKILAEVEASIELETSANATSSSSTGYHYPVDIIIP